MDPVLCVVGCGSQRWLRSAGIFVGSPPAFRTLSFEILELSWFTFFSCSLLASLRFFRLTVIGLLHRATHLLGGVPRDGFFVVP
jgi:hypothetical protein